MIRYWSLAYACVGYALFLATSVYAVGFVGDFGVPKTIDTGRAAPLGEALLVNTLLLGLFALQHSLMARQWFKRAWTRVVPAHAERSTYVLAASLVMLLLFWQWRPIGGVVWQVDAPAAVGLIRACFWLGWVLAMVSTFLISHGQLLGLSQAWAHGRGSRLPAPEFKTPSLYRYVRHPLYLGFLLAFWAAPTLSVGHFMFAMASTGYVLLGVWFEERDLVRQFGARYSAYRESVGMLIPRVAPGRRKTPRQPGS